MDQESYFGWQRRETEEEDEDAQKQYTYTNGSDLFDPWNTSYKATKESETKEKNKKEEVVIMSEVVKYDEKFAFTQDQINIIKSQIAKGATDDELKMFVTIAQKYGLDPFLKEIWFIKQAKKQKDSKGIWDYPRSKDGSIDYTNAETMIYTSRDGYLKVAQRDHGFAGIISFVIREGDIFEVDAENYKVIHKFGSKRGKIIGAWAKVDHTSRKPVIVFVDFLEYYSDRSPIWKQYPSAMIIKVAEVFALKRQFGISGLVTKEELSAKILEVEEVDEVEKISEEQIKKIIELTERIGQTSETLLKWIKLKFNKENIHDLSYDEYELLYTALESKENESKKTA